MFGFGIRQRILLLVGAPILLVAALLAGLFIVDRIEQAREEQQRRLAAVARQIAASAEYHIFVDNRDALSRLLALAVREPDIDAAAIADSEGMILASTTAKGQIPPVFSIPEGFRPAENDQPNAWQRLAIRPNELVVEEDAFSTYRGLYKAIGHVLLAINDQPLRAEIRQQLTHALQISLLVLAFGLIAAYLLAHRLIALLEEIGKTIEAVGSGRKGQRVHSPGNDELGRLAQGINRMAERVEWNQSELARRIEEATKALRAEKEAAEAAAAARSRFFAAASHDLRQPLQALALTGLRLERDAKNSPLLPRIIHLNQSIRAMQSLLDSLLDYSRLFAGTVRSRPQAVSAKRAIEAVIQELAPLAAEKKLSLRLRCPHECWLQTDPALLHRILLNLVSNALRHTTHGGVLVACRRRREKARIEVWDTGPGIPEEMRESIFEEFVQLGNPERDPTKGIGLGLAIVRRTAEMLDHPLRLCSRLGHGSCFMIEIPYAFAPETSELPLSRVATPTLLVCDPAGENGELARLLRRMGFSCECVAALAAVSRDMFAAADLIVIDRVVPMATVIARLDALEAEAEQRVPTLILDADETPAPSLGGEHRHRLRKPYRAARLRALIDHLLAGG